MSPHFSGSPSEYTRFVWNAQAPGGRGSSQKVSWLRLSRQQEVFRSVTPARVELTSSSPRRAIRCMPAIRRRKTSPPVLDREEHKVITLRSSPPAYAQRNHSTRTRRAGEASRRRGTPGQSNGREQTGGYLDWVPAQG